MGLHIKDYETAKAYLATARSKVKGKPISTFARLHEVKGVVSITVNGKELGIIHPNSVFQFTMSPQSVYANAYTLSGHVSNILPFFINRHSKGEYNVSDRWGYNYVYDADTGKYRNEAQDGVNAPYREGLMWDMKGETALNAEPRIDRRKAAIPERRKAWLRDLRWLKTHIKTMHRVGGLGSIMEEGIQDFSSSHQRKWSELRDTMTVTDTDFLDALQGKITPSELLKRTARDCAFHSKWRISHLTAEGKSDWLLHKVESYLRNNSVALRTAYGVFGDAK